MRYIDEIKYLRLFLPRFPLNQIKFQIFRLTTRNRHKHFNSFNQHNIYLHTINWCVLFVRNKLSGMYIFPQFILFSWFALFRRIYFLIKTDAKCNILYSAILIKCDNRIWKVLHSMKWENFSRVNWKAKKMVCMKEVQFIY